MSREELGELREALWRSQNPRLGIEVPQAGHRFIGKYHPLHPWPAPRLTVVERAVAAGWPQEKIQDLAQRVVIARNLPVQMSTKFQFKEWQEAFTQRVWKYPEAELHALLRNVRRGMLSIDPAPTFHSRRSQSRS